MKAIPILVVFLMLFLASWARAAPGDLDPDFGQGGKVRVPIGTSSALQWAAGLLLQPDGKSILVGTRDDCVVLVRLNADGTMDPSFNAQGTSGYQTTCYGATHAFAARLQEDGKIVVVGRVNGHLSVFRYTADGILDGSFCPDSEVPGILWLAGGTSSVGRDLLIQKDGAILVAGEYRDSEPHALLGRILPNGEFDATFAKAGLWFSNSEGMQYYQDSFYAVARGSDGHIYAANLLSPPNSNTLSFVYGFTSEGGLDFSFGDMGVNLPILGSLFSIEDLALQSDGKIVFTGTTYDSTSQKTVVMLARLNVDGSPDYGFGQDAASTVSFGPSYDNVWDLALQGNNQALILGSQGSNVVTAARFKTDGSLDGHFGQGGKVTINFGGTRQQGNVLAVQSDGKILILATVDKDFALARLMGNSADLSLSATSESSDDGHLTYHYTVHNEGPDPAEIAAFADTLPPELKLIDAVAAGKPCDLGAELHCPLGAIAAGASVEVSVLAETLNPPGKGLRVENTASISLEQVFDPDPTNNSLTVTTDWGGASNVTGGAGSGGTASAGGCSLNHVVAPATAWLQGLLFFLAFGYAEILRKNRR